MQIVLRHCHPLYGTLTCCFVDQKFDIISVSGTLCGKMYLYVINTRFVTINLNMLRRLLVLETRRKTPVKISVRKRYSYYFLNSALVPSLNLYYRINL
jgi:hypothetical protein